MKAHPSSAFALVIGLVLLIEGIAGLSSPVIFDILTTNQTHAIIHIILGLTGIMIGSRSEARGYCIFLGILLLLVGILFFVPGTYEIIANLLNINPAAAYLNMIIGAFALIVAYVPWQKSVKTK